MLHALLSLALATRHPPHALNVTVVNLRPYNMSEDISQKDTADVRGDIFFYLADKLVLAYYCRRNPGHGMCNGYNILTNPTDVFTQQVVEVDGTFGGCESGNATCSAYADCNPYTDKSTGKIEWFCGCREQEGPWSSSWQPTHSPHHPQLGGVDRGPCNVTGKVAIDSRYCFDGTPSHHPRPSPFTPPPGCRACADGCHDITSEWKSLIGLQTRGMWYSTAAQGDCRNASGACAWRVVATVKTINATCANDHLHAAIEAHARGVAEEAAAGASCFDACPAHSPRDSDCYILCTVQTVTGRDPLHLDTPPLSKPMSADSLGKPLADALANDDPKVGGCPALPPYVPPIRK
jgi:hypothetical protein